MNPLLHKLLCCPNCKGFGHFIENLDCLVCNNCESHFKLIENRPVFSKVDSHIVEDHPVRPPGGGSGWRRSNWDFIKTHTTALPPKSIILEIGTGRGHYKQMFSDNYIGTDIHLTKATDFVCNLIDSEPIKPESVDCILLIDVLEHVFDFEKLLANTLKCLKAGGLLLVTVPFGSIHFAPYDYFRYTHFCLGKFAEKHQLKMEKIEAVYYPSNSARKAVKAFSNSITDNKKIRNILAKTTLKFAASVLIRMANKLAVDYTWNGVHGITDLNTSDKSKYIAQPDGFHAAYKKI